MLQPQALRYFSEVARTGSLRHASDAHFVAPSAISRQIANLEKELGVDLFERSSRGMMLTEAGQLMLRFVQQNTSSIERFLAQIEDLSQLGRGTVRVASVEATTSDFLPGLMATFGQRYPGIHFQIMVLGTHQVAEQVACDAADIGLAFNIPSREDLILQGRIAQPMQVVYRPGHALARSGSLAMTQLDGMPIALPDRTFGIRHVIEHAAQTAGIPLNLVHESNSLQLLKALVRTSDIVSFMPRMTFEREAQEGTIGHSPLDDVTAAQASIDIVSAQGRKLPIAARTFLRYVQEHSRGA